VYDVTRFADRWVAAGGVDNRAAVWTSSDGLTWDATTPIDPDPIVDNTPGENNSTYLITTLAEFDGDLMAFGWNRFGCCDGAVAAMWRSSDGVTWDFVDTTSTAFAVHQFPSDAIRTPSGSMLVLGITGLGSGTSVFLTPDAETWEEVTLTEVGSFGVLRALATSGTLLVAVGIEDVRPERRQLVMVSTDGRMWETVPPPSAAGTLSSVTWDPIWARFIAAGNDEAGRPSVWLSADARSWARIQFADDLGTVARIGADEGLIIATGHAGDAEAMQVTAWSSHDGVTWRVVPLGAPGSGSAISATAGGSSVAWVSRHAFAQPPTDEPGNEVWVGKLEP
jgi:hypothetical protein